MQKVVWVIIGCAVVIGAVLLFSRPVDSGKLKRAQGTHSETGSGKETAQQAAAERAAESVDDPSPAASEAVQTLIVPETNYETRLDAMSRLGYEIPAQDVDALMDFLRADIPGNATIPGGAYNSVRNDLYEVLLRQKKMPGGMGTLLVDVVNNPDQDGTRSHG